MVALPAECTPSSDAGSQNLDHDALDAHLTRGGPFDGALPTGGVHALPTGGIIHHNAPRAFVDGSRPFDAFARPPEAHPVGRGLPIGILPTSSADAAHAYQEVQRRRGQRPTAAGGPPPPQHLQQQAGAAARGGVVQPHPAAIVAQPPSEEGLRALEKAAESALTSATEQQEQEPLHAHYEQLVATAAEQAPQPLPKEHYDQVVASALATGSVVEEAEMEDDDEEEEELGGTVSMYREGPPVPYTEDQATEAATAALRWDPLAQGGQGHPFFGRGPIKNEAQLPMQRRSRSLASCRSLRTRWRCRPVTSSWRSRSATRQSLSRSSHTSRRSSS